MEDKNLRGKKGRGAGGGRGAGQGGGGRQNSNSSRMRERLNNTSVDVIGCGGKAAGTEPVGKRAKRVSMTPLDLTPVPGKPLPTPGKPARKPRSGCRNRGNNAARQEAVPSLPQRRKSTSHRVRAVAAPVRRQLQRQGASNEGDPGTGEETAVPMRAVDTPHQAARHSAAGAKPIDKNCQGRHSRTNPRPPGLPSAVGASSLQYGRLAHHGCLGNDSGADSQSWSSLSSRSSQLQSKSKQARLKPAYHLPPSHTKNQAHPEEGSAAAQAASSADHVTSDGKMHHVHLPERTLEFRQCRVPRRRQDLPGATTPLPFIVDGFLSQAEISTLYKQGQATRDAIISGNHRMRALEWSPLFTKIARRATMLVPQSWDLDHVYVGDFVLLQQCKDTDTMDQVIHADGTDGLSVIVCINSTPIPCTQHFGGGISTTFQGVDNWMMRDNCKLVDAPSSQDLSKALAGYTLFDPELKLEGEVMMRKGDACVFSQTAWHRGPRWRRRKVIFFQIRKQLPGSKHPGQIFNWTMPLFLLGDSHRICRLILALVIKRGRADFLDHMYTEEQIKRLKRSISRKFAKTPSEDIVAELRHYFPVITGTIQRAHVPRISVADLNVRKHRRRMAAMHAGSTSSDSTCSLGPTAGASDSRGTSQAVVSHAAAAQASTTLDMTAVPRHTGRAAAAIDTKDDANTNGNTVMHAAWAAVPVSSMPAPVLGPAAPLQPFNDTSAPWMRHEHESLPPSSSALLNSSVSQPLFHTPNPAKHKPIHHHE